MTKTCEVNFVLILCMAVVTACAAPVSQKRDGKKSKTGAEEPEEQSEDGLPEDGEKLPDDFTSEDPGKADEEIQALLTDCGGGDAISAAPDKVIYERELQSLPIVTERQQPLIGVVTATSDSTLAIKVTGTRTEQTSKVTVKSLTPALAATLGRATADAEAAANSGKATLANVPFKEYATLNQHKQWEGVTCAFVPVTSIDNQRGGKSTKATFATPLPSSISPKASAKRYEEEIGAKRVFSDIKIKISASDHPDLKNKSEISGNITVEKIDPATTVSDGKGGKKEIKSDLAYKITYDLGGPKATFALGFAPVVSYYISHSKKDLVANIVDTTSAGGGIAVFLHP